MTSRERVLKVINREIPDRVPWMEAYVYDSLVSRIIGREVKSPDGTKIPKEAFEVLAIDNLSYDFRPPEFVDKKNLKIWNMLARER